jgi:coenzyme F420-0:L-glutamate ligase/coenzyme F420-1:gamma-L-glutamate ligase
MVVMSTHLPETIRGAPIRDLVLERRSIRLFEDEPLSRDVIRDLLADAQWAPSPHNSQPWRFTVLFDLADKERLASSMAAQLGSELSADGIDRASVHRQTERSQRRITRAPVVVVCSLVRDGLVSYPDERRDDLEWQMAVQSVGSVLQTLFLLAAARGIGSCWMAAPMYCPDVVRAALQLPSHYVPQALALLGFATGQARRRQRRPLDEIVDLR